MTTLLEQKVADLPEIYQTIYGHSEWDSDASRDCNARLGLIEQQYDVLTHQLGRPLRVLDLGCAQGFFSLSLAARGAHVTGIDFLPQNIAVCQALADENPGFSIQFREGKIEDIIMQLEEGEFDLAIGLSVFHHIVHLHGLAKTKKWLERLVNLTSAVILELAVKEEPLYWSVSLPEEVSDLIEHCAFYRVLEQFPTHLSEISRPLYIVSNHLLLLENFTGEFQSWASQPYRGAGSAHHGSRRYYWGEYFFAKVFGDFLAAGSTWQDEFVRNHEELAREKKLISKAPEALQIPSLIASGSDDELEWLVVEHIRGQLISDLLADHQTFDHEKVLKDVLDQLVILEQSGLYHDDVRPWNIMLSEEGTAYLIDLGSVSQQFRDCDWPRDIIQSFMVFVNEIYGVYPQFHGLRRAAPISPFALPEPVSNWLYAVWQQPVQQWSFELLQRLFDERNTLPSYHETITANDKWIEAQELILLESQSLSRGIDNHLHQLAGAQHQAQERQQSLEQKVAELAEALELLQHQHSDQSIVVEELSQQLAAFDPPPLPPGPEEQQQVLEDTLAQRTSELEQARTEINRLTADNQRLNEELHGLYHSRSWRITRGGRYIGTQLRRLKHEGPISRVKALVKKVLRKIISLLKRHPALKERVKTLLHKTGLYGMAASLYWRLNSYPQQSSDEDQEDRMQNQIARPELIPDEVHRVFSMLKTRN